MEHIKRIKNLLRIILVCTLVLLYSSCYTDLTYGTREHGRINATKYSNYQTRNLRNFSTQKHLNGFISDSFGERLSKS